MHTVKKITTIVQRAMEGFMQFRNVNCALLFFVFLIIQLYPTLVVAKPAITAEEYAQRRLMLYSMLDSGCVFIVTAAQPLCNTDHREKPFKQNSTFYYFTGLIDQDCVLLIVKDGFKMSDSETVHTILFVRVNGASWEGPPLSFEECRQIAGISSPDEIIMEYDSLETILDNILKSNRQLFYTPSLPAHVIDPIALTHYHSWREAKQKLETKYPNIIMRDANEVVTPLRIKKSPSEIRILRKAVDYTIEALKDLMRQTKPGIVEYDVRIMLRTAFERQGVTTQGFAPIIATGANALYPHYRGNSAKLKKGDLLLVDCGAETAGYTADLTRTFPVGGKFTAKQKLLYELILEARDSGIACIEPGATLQQANERMVSIIDKRLRRMGIIDSSVKIKTVTKHSFSHFVGLNVHDVGSLTTPLEPGMVIAIEPAVYLPESEAISKHYRGMAIRIEDMVVVHEDGCSLLSALAPTTVEEIERICIKTDDQQLQKKSTQQ